MTTLIGSRCTHSNVFSRGALIHRRRILLGNLYIICSNIYIEFDFLFWWFGGGVTPGSIPNPAVKPSGADDTRKGKVGSRQNKVSNYAGTRQLSPLAPMILARGK